MNFRTFSLESLQPSGTQLPATGSAVGRPDILPKGDLVPVFPPQVDPDPWAASVRRYGPIALKALQTGGAKSVKDLYEITKRTLSDSGLQANQFENIIYKMILGAQVEIVNTADSLSDSLVALPIAQKR